MTRPVDYEQQYERLDARIARAKELGWSAQEVGNGFWMMNDPAPSQFSGLGYDERDAFADVLADPELWDEIEALLYPPAPPLQD